jgi:serine/threonine protein kinase
MADMPEVQPDATLVGSTLGAYRVLESLGSGGMGRVYLAEDPRLGRRVALKVLPPETASQSEKLARFEREARAVASLSHPGIVMLHSIEEADGMRFLTMEYVEGETLSKAIPARGFATERFLSLAIGLTDAVAAAHRQGILHRDLKPENVMLTPDGRLKVLDFGLAKLRDDAFIGDRTTRETQSVTQTGASSAPSRKCPSRQGLPVDNRPTSSRSGSCSTRWRPASARSAAVPTSVLSPILKDTPRSVSELRDDIPRPLARMIERAREAPRGPLVREPTRRDLEDPARRGHGRPVPHTPAASGWWRPAAGAAGRCRSRWVPRSSCSPRWPRCSCRAGRPRPPRTAAARWPSSTSTT